MSHWSCADHEISKYPNVIKFFMEKSIYFLKKNNYKIHLITDYEGKKQFGELNWDSISTDLVYLDKQYSSVWSAGKVFAINKIVKLGKPFFHIDYDFMIIKPLSEKILNAGIVTEFQYNPYGDSSLAEEDVDINHIAMDCPDYFLKNCKDLHLYFIGHSSSSRHPLPKAAPYLANPSLCKKAFNCGIIGGNNIKFFENYSTGALSMLFDKRNKDFWLTNWEIHKIFEENFTSATKAKLLEQFYLGLCISMIEGDVRLVKPINLISEAKKNKNLQKAINLIDCLEKREIFDETGYIHFLGVLPKVFFLKHIYSYDDREEVIRSLWKKYQRTGKIRFLDHKKLDCLKWMLEAVNWKG